MTKRLFRPLLIFEFLLAIEVVFTFWSEVGGQYHLDLMFWAWKAGFGLAAAALIVGITAEIARNNGAVTRRSLFLCSLLIVIAIAAGVVTYYYHLHEPSDDQNQDEEQPVKITRVAHFSRAAIPCAGPVLTDNREERSDPARLRTHAPEDSAITR